MANVILIQNLTIRNVDGMEVTVHLQVKKVNYIHLNSWENDI